MKTFKISLMVLFLATAFYSCTTTKNNNFSKIKYLDKHLVKNMQVKHKSEVFTSDSNRESNLNTVLPFEDYEANVNTQFLPKPALGIINTQTVDLIDNSIKYEDKTISTPTEIYTELFQNKRKGNERKTYPASIYKTQGAVPIIEVILAFFIPPLAVFLHRGLDSYFWISLILTILFWVPGIIFALLVVLDVI
ncbi:MAG TPA: YqaE/Pmp3 family membrane protein [Bacteroidia bacterium]|nr:YqaE/Pmp3 family membrane protein [Bacteroidia bacterium]